MEEGLRKSHSLFFFWKGMIFVDRLIDFLMMVGASIIGILTASWIVDGMQKLRNKWRWRK